MKLSSLLRAVEKSRWPIQLDRYAPAGAADDPDIDSIAHDSRLVGPGTLFCCITGLKVDGHRFANDAARAGAAALLVERQERTAPPLPQLIVTSSRAAMGPLAAALHGQPSAALEIIGVTGTNGKTTTVMLLGHILRSAGRSVELLGTLTGARTTPEATELQERFAAFRERGVQNVAMEVSSHALELHRVDGTRFRAVLFTNLSPEHLDFHPTMEAYFRAKARLFDSRFADLAVVNSDDPRGRLLVDTVALPSFPFSINDAKDLKLRATSSTFVWRGHAVELPMGGHFNVSNALGAATVAAALGIDEAVIASALASAPVVPGRFELVRMGQPFAVVVDYAHTPAALEGVLESTRAAIPQGGRLILVFGCGGERDRLKRPLMGEVATRLADTAILTSDNPRSEDPLKIIEEVRKGMREVGLSSLHVEPDRRVAIGYALAAAQEHDSVVIAGKGHETGQEIGGVTFPFDDRQIVETILAARFGSGRSTDGRGTCE